MISILDEAIVAHPTVEPTLFVDDVSGEKDGEADDIAEELGSFTWKVVQLIRADDMDVSATKSLVSASNPSLGKAIEHKLQVKQAVYEQSVTGTTCDVPNNTPSPSPSSPQGILPQEVSAPPPVCPLTGGPCGVGAGGVQEGSKGNKGKRKCERVNRPTKPTLNRKVAVRPRRVKPVNKNTNSSGKGTRRALHLIGRITNLPKPIVRYALRVKSLGAGLAAGVARNSTVMLHRLRQFKSRLSRYKMLRQAGVNTAMLVRTGGLAALMHGYMALGVPPPLYCFSKEEPSMLQRPLAAASEVRSLTSPS